MSTLLAAIVVVVVVGGNEASQCCFPRQYTATQGLMRGTVTSGGHLQILYMPLELKGLTWSFGMAVATVMGNNVFFYDGVNQKEAFVEDLTIDGVEQRLTVIRDYTKRTKYVITNNGTRCTKKSLPRFNHGCVPDSAIKLVDSYIGVRPNTTSGMSMNVYDNSGGGVTSFLITAKDDCLFVLDVSAQPTGPSPNMQVVMYYNMTVGAPPSSVFAVPSVCNTASQPVG